MTAHHQKQAIAAAAATARPAGADKVCMFLVWKKAKDFVWHLKVVGFRCRPLQRLQQQPGRLVLTRYVCFKVKEGR